MRDMRTPCTCAIGKADDRAGATSPDFAPIGLWPDLAGHHDTHWYRSSPAATRASSALSMESTLRRRLMASHLRCRDCRVFSLLSLPSSTGEATQSRWNGSCDDLGHRVLPPPPTTAQFPVRCLFWRERS